MATIRPATVADARVIAEVHLRTWQDGYRGLLPDDYLKGLSVESWIERRTAQLEMRDLSVGSWVAVENDAVLGFAIAGPSRDPDGAGIGELYAIYVSSESWRAGIGRELLAAAETFLREAGFTVATLWLLQGNARAASFYEQAGWKLDRTTKTDEIDGVKLPEARYRKAL